MISKRKLFTVSVLALLFLSMFVGVWQIKPVYADSGYFGFTTVGSETAGGVGYATQTPLYSISQTITVTTITAYFKNAGNGRVALYDSSNAVQVQSASEAVSANQWHIFDVVDKTASAGNYRLALQGSVDNFFAKNSDEGLNSPYRAMSYGAFPSTFSKDGDYSYTRWSIYANYTTGGSDTYPPTFGLIAANTTIAGNPVKITCVTTDSFGVDYIIPEWNNTGHLENLTTIDALNSSWFSAEFAGTWNVTSGIAIRVRFYANDTSGNWGTSSFKTFTVAEYDPPANYTHVSGNQFFAPNGTAIKLKGVNLDVMIDTPDGHWVDSAGTMHWFVWDTDLVDYDLEKIREWNATVLRLLFSTEFWINDSSNFREHVDYILNKTEALGLWVAFVPWRNNGTGSQPTLPWSPYDNGNNVLNNSQDFVDMWSSIASVLKTHDNVIFELWNEPNTESATVYFPVAQEAVNAIRSQEAYNPVCVEWEYGIGTDYYAYPDAEACVRGDMTWIEDFPLTDIGSNLLYSTHTYSSGFYNSSNGYEHVSDYTLLTWGLNITGFTDACSVCPVWLEEIGANVWESNQTNELLWYDTILSIANNTEGCMGFAGWVWRGTGQAFPLYNYAADLPPTTSGLILQTYLTNFVGSGAVTLTITSPTNTTYFSSSISVSLSASGGTIDKIIWNCTYTNGTVAYANTVYTAPTSMTLANGSYIFNARANNTDDEWDEATVTFTVTISASSVTLIITSPSNTTYSSSTIPVLMSASGGTIDRIWWNIQFENASWLYPTNQTYTVATSATIDENLTATFHGYANNTDGNSDDGSVIFTVYLVSNTIGYQLGQAAIGAAGFMGIVMLLGMVYVVAEGKDVKYAVMLAVGEVLLLATMLILSQLAILG